jgi:hypothetical protein
MICERELRRAVAFLGSPAQLAQIRIALLRHRGRRSGDERHDAQ